MLKLSSNRKDKEHELAGWPLWIGQQVQKQSGKPFKSDSKLNTVKGIMIHPITGSMAFTFEEDDSYVECFRTRLVPQNFSWDDAPSWALGYAFEADSAAKTFGTWQWQPASGSHKCLSYITRPMSHIDFADDEIQDMLWANEMDKKAHEDRRRQIQSLRDKRKNDVECAVNP